MSTSSSYHLTTRSGLSRRVVLSLPALVAAGGLVACDRGGAAIDSSASPSASSASSSSQAAIDAEVVATGESLTVVVGPLVRVSHRGADLTILPLDVTRSEDGAAPTLDVAAVVLGGTASALGAYRPLRLIDPEGSRVWSTTIAQSTFDPVGPGGSLALHPTFGPVDADTVTVLLSHGGFIEVPVVDADDARAPELDVVSAIAESSPQDSLRDPVTVERYSVALDGSTSGLTTGDETSVDVASDVTFAVDSAELTAQADNALKGVAETIGGYDGGDLTITGHTDDVADDAHNQTLSEQRARAVADRLGRLTDLGAWTQTVTGKGESEPKVANDTEEGRQANRRVEVVIAPTDGTDDALVRSAGGAEIPEATGPTAKGPDGATVGGGALGLGQVTVRLDQVLRRGSLLLGVLEITGGKSGSLTPLGTGWLSDPGSVLNNVRGELGGATSLLASDGLTLLSGSDRIYPVDYLLPESSAHRALTELELTEILADGQTSRVCVAWPDTGEDTVMVDHPAGGALPCPWRLTDVPVVAG